uniref:SAM-dependent methyltransferase n=1 Tax=candidate division WOR-3 bacterium TaxID=2052148 RepID=A0A7V3ZV97_UNCW3
MEIFNKHFKEYDEWYEKNKWVYLSEVVVLKKVIPKGKKGLEIGVGTGRFAQALGIEYGIDPSEKMLSIAKKRGIKTFVGRGEKLPFSDKEFDYVALIITLCFVENPEEVIKEAKRVLKDNGKIVIGIIAKNSPLGKIYQEKKEAGHKIYKYANFFTVEEVVDLLKRNGFKNFVFYQTLFKPLEEIKEIEEPKEGFGEGSFVVIAAEKTI